MSNENTSRLIKMLESMYGEKFDNLQKKVQPMVFEFEEKAPSVKKTETKQETSDQFDYLKTDIEKVQPMVFEFEEKAPSVKKTETKQETSDQFDYLKTDIENWPRRDIVIFDFDGVVTNTKFMESELAKPEYREEADIAIVTGRCLDEANSIQTYIIDVYGVVLPIYFNPMSVQVRGRGTSFSRTASAEWKATIASRFMKNGTRIRRIFEDDPEQIAVMCKLVPTLTNLIVHVPNEKKDY